MTLHLGLKTRYVAASVVTDRQTEQTTTVTLTHALRVNNIMHADNISNITHQMGIILVHPDLMVHHIPLVEILS